jgi:nitrogen fixation protein NifB
MRHCTRCRADAVGLLGEKESPALMQNLVSCQNIVSFESLGKSNCKSNIKEKPYVAVASHEGVLVNQHLGEAYQLLIFKNNGNEVEFVEQRTTPEPGGGDRRWQSLSKTLSDCRALLVSGIGGNPRKVLEDNGIDIYEVEGVIIEAVKAIYEKKSLKRFTVCKIKSCGTGCGGNAMGCG